MVNTVPELTDEIPVVKLTMQIKRKLLEERPSNLPTSMNKQQILIGADYFHDIFRTSSYTKLPSGFYLVSTIFGDMISGRGSRDNLTPLPEEGRKRFHCNVVSSKDELQQFWSLEFIGVHNPPCQTDDELAIKQFKQAITFENGRYNRSWPLKSPTLKPDNNFGLRLGRLMSSLTGLRNNPELLAAYEKTFNEQLRAGIIEEVTHVKPQGLTYYMPHQAVIKPDSLTTKIRIVYDASSKAKGNHNSLNDVLLKGPLLLPDLCGILLRSRLTPVLVTADIEKAFLQLGLHQNQRDAVRFLWVNDVNAPVNDVNLKVFRFTRVPFGVTSSPFLLDATIQHHLDNEPTELKNEIKRNICREVAT
ncbi:hypothetical protein AB6A40_008569 [Gnathostoma spinigerum]|uniref:DUF1758 domain-containing protein n=1 Tax=Gnathostoma spinigerum TaxID=75299 RepID=A0ABD6EPF7_9BILA